MEFTIPFVELTIGNCVANQGGQTCPKHPESIINSCSQYDWKTDLPNSPCIDVYCPPGSVSLPTWTTSTSCADQPGFWRCTASSKKIVAPCMHTGASWQNTSLEPWWDLPRRHRNSDASRENFRSRCSCVKGDAEIPDQERGVRVLGAPIGSSECVLKNPESNVCCFNGFQQFPICNQLGCGATRANFWLCMVRPGLTAQFAEQHDSNVWQCFATLLGLPEGQPAVAVSMPLNKGGLGLGSAVRSRRAAHWASWADCLSMVHKRDPAMARWMVEGIQHDPAACFHAVRECQRELANVGWPSLRVVPSHRRHSRLFPLLRSPVSIPNHSGCSSLIACALPCFSLPTRHIWPSSSIMCGGWGPWQTRVGSGTGCTSLPRRRWSSLNQRDVEGLGRRTTSNGWQKIGDCCGWFAPLLRRPTRNRHHHGVPSAQGRTSNSRSSVHSRGRIAQSPPQERANFSRAARSRWGGRARLVVLAVEVGGRWSNEAAQFFGELAAFKASTAPEILRERVRGAWFRRWRNILSCSAAKAFVLSLLDKRPVTGVGSCPPSAHEVVREYRRVV